MSVLALRARRLLALLVVRNRGGYGQLLAPPVDVAGLELLQRDAGDLVANHPPGEAFLGVQSRLRLARAGQVPDVVGAGHLHVDRRGLAAAAQVREPVPGCLAGDVEARMRRVVAELAQRALKLLSRAGVAAASQPGAGGIGGHLAIAEKAARLDALPVRVAARRQAVARFDLAQIDRAPGDL